MAAGSNLFLTITRVDGPVFDGEAQFVTVPGSEGEMTILAHHEAFISPLKAGTIVVRRVDDTEETFDIDTGILEMSSNHATVLI